MTGFSYSRFEQHIELPNVGIGGQEKISAASVLIVGCGGLGCPASLYLIAAGLGRLGLVDSDVVEKSNLQRQVLYGNEDLGKKKVDVAKEKLQQLSENQRIDSYDTFLNIDNANSLISEYDIIVDATDNHQARLIINQVCKKLKKPWVYGSLYHFEGQIMAFDFKREDTPCFSCIFSDIHETTSLPTCKSAGVLSTVPGVIGNLQATEVLKLILDLDHKNKAPTLHLINLLTYNFSGITVARNPNCKICGNDQIAD